MKNNEIKLEDFQKWLESEEINYAYSSRENKKLSISLKGNFILRVASGVVWQGTQPYRAVEEYNKITEKWVNPLKDFKI